MPKVAVVRLRYVTKDYWFNPAGIPCEEGDHVVVETARGKEIGLVVEDIKEVEDKEVQQPLKPVLRLATQEDLDQADEMNARGEEAMLIFRDLIEKHDLEMKPIRVEFMFTGDFATFYFAADDRVDFRSLVRDLAAEFHIRVDMRQIGVRDEARILGGLGHCGEELCCARMGGEFQPVSIRMAKEQDLPLNPSKISGLCGRLMCCLRYEFEAYKDFKGRAPKKNALIDTPMGMAKVVEFDTPREQLRLRMEDGSSLVVPLSSMDTGDKQPKEGERLRPCHIGQEAFDKILEDLHHDENLAIMGDKLFSSDNALADKVAESGQLDRTVSEGRKRGKIAMGSEKVGAASDSHDDRRRRRRVEEEPKVAEPQVRDQRRRRRSVTIGVVEESAQEQTAATESAAPVERRPRQRRASRRAERAEKLEKAVEAPREDESAASEEQAKPSRRRRRGGRGRGGSNSASAPASAEPKPQQPSKPRPGQNSSTLHGDKTVSASQPSGDADKASKSRRRRRRGGRGRGGNGGAASSGSAE